MIKRLTLLGSSMAILSLASLNAAQYALFNAAGGPGVDTLWANEDGSLMDATGFVTMGYFGASVTDSDLDSVGKLVSQLGGFTELQTSTPNISTVSNPVTIFTEPGYVANDFRDDPDILAGDPLLGRRLYAIASNASSVAAATIGNTFSVFFVDTIKDDGGAENSYVANPAGVTPVLGTTGSITGHTSALGNGDYDTIRMVAIPEPTTALLVTFGSLALLRRRRS